MAHRIVRTPRARLDLIEIWNFIADDNEAAADGVLRRIDGVLATLAENPLAGRARPDLRPGIRSFPVGNYVLFYRVTPDTVDVVRVRSRYMDINADDFGNG